ncbi:deoxyribonuclease-1-like, partial [Pecten maximus]|uniref:deoxyribonuclease-1-like n=1 Tax=Pecten maximus TaxID=6579 RepID=UPI0014588C72
MAGFITGKFLFGIFAFLTIQFGTCLSKMLEENLRISAFNLRMFGDARAENTDVVEILAKIIRRYDISILQEIRDKDGSAFKLLMNEINGNTDEYASDLSQRLGTSHIKEEYAVVYRKDTVRLDDTYQYPDPDYDYFERPPFSVKVHLKTADELDEMAIIAIHTKPTEAVEEIDKLVDVSKNTSDYWNGLKNILIAGDLNAGCSYVTTKEMKIISLRKDKRYSWLIGDDVDTTTSGSDCAYDRFVASGDQLKAAIVPGSAREFKFEEEYNLSEKQMKEVSDHYPIELEIRGR